MAPPIGRLGKVGINERDEPEIDASRGAIRKRFGDVLNCEALERHLAMSADEPRVAVGREEHEL
eukprot:1313487-Prymnesium_polylepis.1